jgi:type II secretory pathway pseudopilin PulG
MNDTANQLQTRDMDPSSARLRRDGGYMLLAIMLMMAIMIIAATAAAPAVVQQMKRDREEEMIHRGTQYARAIKAFYKKNGRYPASLDDLDKGQVKYLRQRYKDPLAKDGKWKLLNYGDIATLLNGAAPGTPAASLGTLGGSNTTPGSGFSNSASPVGFGSQGAFQPQQQQAQQPGGFNGGYPSNSDVGGNGEGVAGGNFAGNATGSGQGSGSNASGNDPSSQPGNSMGQGGTTFGSNSSGNGQTFGGGAIVGVASLSKDPTIRIYNKKKNYNEWQFIYNPMMDQGNVLLQGPYNPTTISSQNIGTPASQMNGQQNPNQSPFGQQNNSGFGQQGSSFGQPSPQPTSSPQ